MKVVSAFLLLVAIALAMYIRREDALIADQQIRLAKLEKEAAAPKTASLELQGKCADQSQKFFDQYGYKPKDIAGFENHYSATLGKCFILIQNTDTSFAPTIWTHQMLFDAFEGKDYGEYHWHTEKEKKYWEVPPTSCKVESLSGEERKCTSDDEFKEFIKIYMQNP
jgi:hypothetical protein